MALPEVETERFSARYRLTSRDARSILWCFVIERAPVFVGLALLVLLTANTSVFGAAGRMTPIVVPLLVAWRLLDVDNPTRRGIGPVKEITTTFDPSGIRTEMAQPSASGTPRATASVGDSPGSPLPRGNSHVRGMGWSARRRDTKTRVASRTSAATTSLRVRPAGMGTASSRAGTRVRDRRARASRRRGRCGR